MLFTLTCTGFINIVKWINKEILKVSALGKYIYIFNVYIYTIPLYIKYICICFPKADTFSI